MLDKGEDLAKKCLAGSTLASKLKTEMEANPYGKDLLTDLGNAETNFKCSDRTYSLSRRGLFRFDSVAIMHAYSHARKLYNDVKALLRAKVEAEEQYLPFGKQYVLLMQDMERPKEAAESLTKAANKKANKSASGKKRKGAPKEQ